MAVVYLGLGSNVGNRLSYIKKAVGKIKSDKSFKIIRCSSIYKTEPWGKKDQEEFLNCALCISTGLNPFELVMKLKNIEKSLGRKKKETWGEREIDIDILFYDDLIYSDDDLSIPHMEIHNRRFVLVPMCEIAPDFVHPSFDKDIIELLEITRDNSNVKLFKAPVK
ncbi:MAG TPA: 2-amino-4-hydroxy-6-hydroxymethyldihydropteridine diphosphokinase [Ignavibacteria bacterium]